MIAAVACLHLQPDGAAAAPRATGGLIVGYVGMMPLDRLLGSSAARRTAEYEKGVTAR